MIYVFDVLLICNSWPCFNNSILEGSCIPEPTGKIPISTQYHVEPASTISFNEARTACQNRGFNWDLVIFDSDEELQYIKKMINCLPEAFWVGYRLGLISNIDYQRLT